jgi:hypothetical protein
MTDAVAKDLDRARVVSLPGPRRPVPVLSSEPSPWGKIPRDLAVVLRPLAGGVAADMLREIQRAVPQYARPLEGPFGKTIVRSVEHGIAQFIERVADPGSDRRSDMELFRMLGRLEAAEGRGLEVLHSACRVGARVAWRRVSEYGQLHKLPVSIMCVIAEAIFAYIDEISRLSLEGYTAWQMEAAGALSKRRRQLLDLLVADPPPAPGAVEELAKAARWRVPERARAVALERTEDADDLRLMVMQDALTDVDGPAPCLVVPAGESTEVLRAALTGWRAAVGPAVPVAELGRSLEWARLCLDLVRGGVLPDEPLSECTDHLSALWLCGDAALADALIQQTLRPLLDLTDKQRQRLGSTLTAWLQTSGSAPEIAASLGVHPQTVRYRMHQLEALFGDRLADSGARFDLMVALRAMELRSTVLREPAV